MPATDRDHVQLVLAPGPKARTVGEAVDVGKSFCQFDSLGLQGFFSDAGELGEKRIERVSPAESVNRLHIGAVRA